MVLGVFVSHFILLPLCGGRGSLTMVVVTPFVWWLLAVASSPFFVASVDPRGGFRNYRCGNVIFFFTYVCGWSVHNCQDLRFFPQWWVKLTKQHASLENDSFAYYNLLWLCDEAKWRKSLCQKNFKTSVQDYHKSEISVDFQLKIDFSEW